MDISEINNSLEDLALPIDQKKAILQLIDSKINNDMKEVISEIKQLEKLLDSKIQITQDKIQMTQEKHSNEIKVVYWVIGIAWTIMLLVLAKK